MDIGGAKMAFSIESDRFTTPYFSLPEPNATVRLVVHFTLVHNGVNIRHVRWRTQLVSKAEARLAFGAAPLFGASGRSRGQVDDTEERKPYVLAVVSWEAVNENTERIGVYLALVLALLSTAGYTAAHFAGTLRLALLAVSSTSTSSSSPSRSSTDIHTKT